MSSLSSKLVQHHGNFDVLDVLHPFRISSESCCHVSFLRAFKTPDLVPSGLPSFLVPQFMEASHVPCVGSRTLWGRASRANKNRARVAKAEVCVDTALWRRQWRGKLMIPVTCQQGIIGDLLQTWKRCCDVALLKFQIYRDVPIPR